MMFPRISVAGRGACAVMLVPLGLSVLGAAADAALPGRVHASAVVRVRPPKPLIHPSAARRVAATTPLYTVDDVGAPSSGIYGAAPVAFNNTGQIIGSGLSLTSNALDCVLYNGRGAFIDVSASPNHFNCQPLSINAQNAKGVVSFVGTVSTLTNPNPLAFYGMATASSGSIGALAGDAQSVLYGINAAGQASGAGYFLPAVGSPGVILDADVAVAEPAAGAALTVLGQCANPPYDSTCPAPIRPVAPCAFGGCTINDAGTILTADGDSSGYLEVKGLSFGSDLPLVGDVGTILLNNAGTLAYESYGANDVVTIVGGKTVPALKGNSCTEYVPLSFNNAGRVLGYTAKCKVAADAVYWTWDAHNGTLDLNAEIAVNNYNAIAPLGVNDLGQILASFTLPSGIVHWGTLNPPASLASKPLGLRQLHAGSL